MTKVSIPQTLSPRMRAEHLYNVLLNFQANRDQMQRVQVANGHEDDDKCGQFHEVDGENEEFTYAGYYANISDQIRRVTERDRDLVPLLPALVRQKHADDERRLKLQELREEKELAEARLEVAKLHRQLEQHGVNSDDGDPVESFEEVEVDG